MNFWNCSDRNRQEKRVERGEITAPKATPRAPVQTAVTPPSSTQPVPSSRPQPSAASTPVTPSTPVPAAAPIPTPAQVSILFFAMRANTWHRYPPDDDIFLRIEGSAVVIWLALVISSSFLSLTLLSSLYSSALSFTPRVQNFHSDPNER